MPALVASLLASACPPVRWGNRWCLVGVVNMWGSVEAAGGAQGGGSWKGGGIAGGDRDKAES